MNIDSLRQFVGTLPSRKEVAGDPVFIKGNEKLRVTPVFPDAQGGIRDFVRWAYRSMFEMATSTWGEGSTEGNWENKWDRVTPAARYMVVWSVLKGKTLPTALESVKFTFQISGIPRHTFDQLRTLRIGAGFASIGCRDNSKIDAEFILYPRLYEMLFEEPEGLAQEEKEIILKAFEYVRKGYATIISKSKRNWQLARALLPMCYHHQTSMTINLLALIGFCAKRMKLCEEPGIVGVAWAIRDVIEQKLGMKLVADVLRPGCDRAKRCTYASSDGSELFSCLFKSCGRWPSDLDYAEVNETCTRPEDLTSAGIKYLKPWDYRNFPRDYTEARKHLSPVEIEVFEG